MQDAFEIEWHVEAKIVLVRLIGKPSDGDILLADDFLCREFLDQSMADNVHIVFDHSRLQNIPPIKVQNKFQFTAHPRLGWCVSFGDNHLTRFFVSTLSQINQVHFRMCPTPDECLRFLQDMDRSLPSTLPPIETKAWT